MLKKSPFDSGRIIEENFMARVNSSGQSPSKFDHDRSGTLFFPLNPKDNKNINSLLQSYDPEDPSSSESLDLMNLPLDLPVTHAKRFLNGDTTMPIPTVERKPRKSSDDIRQVAEYHRKYQEALDFV